MASSSTLAAAPSRLRIEVAYDSNQQPHTVRVTLGSEVVTMSAGEWSRILASPFALLKAA